MRAEDFLDSTPQAGGISAEDFLGPAKQKKQNQGIAADLVTDVKRGVEQLPGAVTGLVDIPIAAVTGSPLVSGLADKAGEITGFQPSKWAKQAEAEYSPSRQAGRAEVDKAWEQGTASDIAGAYLKNPMNIVGSVAESLPSMLAGGLAGRAALGIGAAQSVPGIIARTVGTKMAPAVGAGIGEGGIMAGQAMQNSLDAGVDPRTAAGYAGATGLVGGALGALGGKVAQKMGVVDPETLIAGGVGRQASNATGLSAAREVGKRIAGGAISEGVFEELPQSVFEQGFQNLAQGKPLAEGMARAGVEGALAGSFMGGAFNMLPGSRYAQAKLQERPPEDEQQPIAGLLPAPRYPVGDRNFTDYDYLQANQAAIDAADKNAADLYAMRDAFEASRQNVVLTTDPVPLQNRIDTMLGLDTTRMDKKGRAQYEKDLAGAFNEPVGITHDANQREVSFTMGEYLDAQVAANDAVRARENFAAQAGNRSSVNRLAQLADEEAQQHIGIVQDLARSATQGGALSKAALTGIQTGATQMPVHPERAAIQQQMLADEAAQAELAPIELFMRGRNERQLQNLSAPGHSQATRQAATAEIERRMTEPVKNIATNPVTNVQAGTEQQAAVQPDPQFDVSKRTDAQLANLASAGKTPEKRAAAVAELQRRAATNPLTQVTATPEPIAAQAIQPNVQVRSAEKPAEPQKTDSALQNRDRGRAASVNQMQSIARNPDYMRLGPSRTPDSGAPMVFAVGNDLSGIPAENFGASDVAVMADGQRVPFRYAVIDASRVQPSNFADGMANPAFASNERGTIKALNNGRTAGIRAAHSAGNADAYVGEMIEDGAHGVSSEAIRNAPNPMLVRVYAEDANTDNMAAKSQGQGLGMSASERAAQDAELMTGDVLDKFAPLDIAAAGNRDFVRAFVGKLPENELADMMDATGNLSQDGRRRIEAALLTAAYGKSDLVQELFESTDTDIKAIGNALKVVSGQWAIMRQAAKDGVIDPAVDMTGNLMEAVNIIRRSRAEGSSVAELAGQGDLMGGNYLNELSELFLRIFYRGAMYDRSRSGEKVITGLQDVVTSAMNTKADAGLFGDSFKPTPKQIVQSARSKIDEKDQPASQSALFGANGQATAISQGNRGESAAQPGEVGQRSVSTGSGEGVGEQARQVAKETSGKAAQKFSPVSREFEYRGVTWRITVHESQWQDGAISWTGEKNVRGVWEKVPGDDIPEVVAKKASDFYQNVRDAQDGKSAGQLFGADEFAPAANGESPVAQSAQDNKPAATELSAEQKPAQEASQKDQNKIPAKSFRDAERIAKEQGAGWTSENIERIDEEGYTVGEWFAVKKQEDKSGKPDPGRYVQPAINSSREGQMALADRAGRIATLKVTNDFVAKNNPSAAYSDSEIENAANDRIDAMMDWLIASQKEEAKPADERAIPKLEEIAKRLGITVEYTSSGFHAYENGSMVSVPAEDKDAAGAVSANHILAHELGHAVIMRRGLSFKGMPVSAIKRFIPNYDEFVAASKQFRPGVWNHANDKVRSHAKKPSEVMADAIASVLIGQRPVSLLDGLMQSTGTTLTDLGLQTVEEANAAYNGAQQEKPAAVDAKNQQKTNTSQERVTNSEKNEHVEFARRGDYWIYSGDRAKEIAKVLGLTVTQRNGIPEVAIVEHAREMASNDLDRVGIDVRFAAVDAKKEAETDDGIRYSKVSDAPAGEELVAIHNLSAENVLHAASIGGIPVPSIGITKLSSPFTDFGEITLIADKGMIDPGNSVPVFDRDAYTARFPEFNYKKVTAKKADAFYERMNVARELSDDGRSFISQLWDAVKNARVQSPKKVADLFRTYLAPRMLYAKEVLGKEIKAPMIPIKASVFFGHEKSWRDFVKNNAELKRTDEDAYNAAAAKAIKIAANEFIDRASADNEIRSQTRSAYMAEVDRYAKDSVNWNYLDRAIKSAQDFGKKRVDAVALSNRVAKIVPQDDPGYLKWVSNEISDLFVAPTITLRGKEVEASLDNIVEAMTIGKTNGAEKTLAFGVGRTSALLGKRFKSIKEIQDHRNQVVSSSRESDMKKDSEKLLEEYRLKAVEHFTHTDWKGHIDTFAGFDAAMEALAKAGKGALTDGNIASAMRSVGFKNVPSDVINLARQGIVSIREAATDYFEAKPQRAVKLNEFNGAVVPNGTDPEVIDALKASGITDIRTYKRGDEEGRKKSIALLAKKIHAQNKNTLFSNSAKSATQSEPLPRQQAESRIKSILGDKLGKVLIESGLVTLVDTEQGLKNLPGARYMVAWHGSPHDHDKFDSSKIGTGEGAQAYGWGLYFAGSKDVAEYYKKALSGKDARRRQNLGAIDGVEYPELNSDEKLALQWMKVWGGAEEAIAAAKLNNYTESTPHVAVLRAIANGSRNAKLNTGKLYQVELSPSEDEYLDWDKPLSEQSDTVKAAIEKIKTNPEWQSLVDRQFGGDVMDQATGRDLYKHLANNAIAKAHIGKSGKYVSLPAGFNKEKAASEYLHSLGIRGIRYLDGSSRSAGQGNSNYVIFSDDDVAITAKYAKENGGIRGATLPDGRIVLVLENLNADNFDGVFAHEGFHSAIRDLVGEQTYAQLMKRLDNMRALGNGGQWFKDAIASVPAGTRTEHVTEEIAAYAVQGYVNGAKQPNVITRWVESLLSALRTAIIRRLPSGKLKEWAVNNIQPQDLANLAIAGLKAKARGQLQAQGREAMAYSKINQTDTPAFKKWFGDSKVVDADGKPLVVYHGTDSVFTEFSRTGDIGYHFGTEIAARDRAARVGGAEVLVEPVTLSQVEKDSLAALNGEIGGTPAADLYALLLRKLDSPRQNLRAQVEAMPADEIKKVKAEYLEQPDSLRFADRVDRAKAGEGFRVEVNGETVSTHRTVREANARAARLREQAATPMALYLRIENPIRLPDLGVWPAQEIAKEAGFSKREMERVVEAGTAEQQYEAVRAILESKGFDGIVYRNEVEHAGEDSYIAFHPEQIKSAIGNNGNFDGANPDIRYSRAKIIGDSGRQYDQTQRQFFKNVGRDIEKKNLVERTTEYLKNDFWKKMAVGIVDQFRGLRDLGDNGQAYMLARLSKGTAGAFDALLHHGKLSIRDGVYDADTSGGFIDRLGTPLHGELDDFLWYVAANRAEGLSQQDRENLFSPQDIAAGKSLAKGQTNFDYTIQTGPQKGTTTRNRTLIYADANRVFNEFQKNTLDMAEQSGLIDGASRKLWESEFYVPFYRVSEEDGEFIGAKMGNALVRQQAFKKLKGGTDKLNSDLLSNTLLNFSHLIEASAKNRAAKASLAAAEKIGAADRVAPDMASYAASNGSMLPPGTKGTVWFQENGKKVEYKVSDPFVMTAITSLEYAGMRNGVMDVMTKFKHFLTIGVTASPAFKVRNLIRDSIQSIGASELGYNPIKNITEGYKQTRRDSQEYVSALASGALIRFGTMLEGSESARVRQLVKSGVKDSTILNSENKWRAFYDQYLEPAVSAYNELGNRSEEINRAALYNQLVKQGKSHAEAALLARDLMDFSMQGSFNTIRFLTQVVPFMNARLQGMYKLGRAAKDNPRKLAVVTGAVAMASIALMLAYGDDDDWKRREDWDRDNFWWFKLGGIEFRIPKPFEIGAIATLAERGLELMIDDEMTGERFRRVVNSLAMNNLSMNPIPQAFKPILDLYANKDSFTGRPIESMGMERLDPTERFNSNTTMVARGLSSASLGALSPVQFDHLTRSYFGWLGSFVIGGADMAMRAMSDEPTKPALDYFRFGTQGILKEAGTGGSRYVTQVYEQAKELEQAHATWRQMLKDGRIEEAKDYAADNRDKLIRYRQVEAVKRTESNLNERIRRIERSDMDSSEKKNAIALVNKQKEAVAMRIAPGIQYGP